jgi:hypothetical protein
MYGRYNIIASLNLLHVFGDGGHIICRSFSFIVHKRAVVIELKGLARVAVPDFLPKFCPK